MESHWSALGKKFLLSLSFQTGENEVRDEE